MFVIKYSIGPYIFVICHEETPHESEKKIHQLLSPTESKHGHDTTIIYETYARELNELDCVPIVNQKHLH